MYSPVIVVMETTLHSMLVCRNPLKKFLLDTFGKYYGPDQCSVTVDLVTAKYLNLPEVYYTTHCIRMLLQLDVLHTAIHIPTISSSHSPQGSRCYTRGSGVKDWSVGGLFHQDQVQ